MSKATIGFGTIYRVIWGFFAGRTPFGGQSVHHDLNGNGWMTSDGKNWHRYETFIRFEGNNDLITFRMHDNSPKREEVWLRGGVGEVSNGSKPGEVKISVTGFGDEHSSYLFICEKIEEDASTY